MTPMNFHTDFTHLRRHFTLRRMFLWLRRRGGLLLVAALMIVALWTVTVWHTMTHGDVLSTTEKEEVHQTHAAVTLDTDALMKVMAAQRDRAAVYEAPIVTVVRDVFHPPGYPATEGTTIGGSAATLLP